MSDARLTRRQTDGRPTRTRRALLIGAAVAVVAVGAWLVIDRVRAASTQGDVESAEDPAHLHPTDRKVRDLAARLAREAPDVWGHIHVFGPAERARYRREPPPVGVPDVRVPRGRLTDGHPPFRWVLPPPHKIVRIRVFNAKRSVIVDRDVRTLAETQTEPAFEGDRHMRGVAETQIAPPFREDLRPGAYSWEADVEGPSGVNTSRWEFEVKPPAQMAIYDKLAKTLEPFASSDNVRVYSLLAAHASASLGFDFQAEIMAAMANMSADPVTEDTWRFMTARLGDPRNQR